MSRPDGWEPPTGLGALDKGHQVNVPDGLIVTRRARGHGGRRVGAGRKPASWRRVGHDSRPEHGPKWPVHVTLRVLGRIPSLRSCPPRDVIVGCLEEIGPSRRHFVGPTGVPRFRVVCFSIQSTHLHLICEADSKLALARGIQGLKVRVARGLNRALGRSGQIWEDRYHARPLRDPRQVRVALAYVLGNFRHHGGHNLPLGCVDGCSSAIWFDGFEEPLPPVTAQDRPTVWEPQSWLLKSGWKRYGRISVDAGPWRPPSSPRALDSSGQPGTVRVIMFEI